MCKNQKRFRSEFKEIHIFFTFFVHGVKECVSKHKTVFAKQKFTGCTKCVYFFVNFVPLSVRLIISHILHTMYTNCTRSVQQKLQCFGRIHIKSINLSQISVVFYALNPRRAVVAAEVAL